MKAQSLASLGALLGATALMLGCTASAGSGAGPGGGSGGTTSGPGPSGGGTTGVGPNGMCVPTTTARIWRLSDEQYKTAVTDLIPGSGPQDVVTPGRAAGEFINMSERLPVTGAYASSLRTSVKALASAVVKDLPTLLKCDAATAADVCAGQFIDRFVPRAFHRPIDATERQALLGLYTTGAMQSQADGIRLVLEGVLQAPSFLYRTELGTGATPGAPVQLTPYELATELSFLTTDGMPDDALWQAAQDGTITQPAVLAQHVDRLLQTPRSHEHVTRTFLKWFGLGAGVTTELNAGLFPEYTDALKASMLEESTRFLRNLLDTGGTLNDMFTSRKTYVDQNLATLYGIPFAGASGFVEAMLPAERAGILTQAGVLVSKSRGHQIVIRGKFVRRDLFCQDVPSPPPTINIQMFSGGNLTERQQSTERQNHPVCGACHKLMDPIGISFEQFDALSRYKPTDATTGMPVDSAGTLSGTDEDGAVSSPSELGAKLAASAEVRSCVSKQLLAFSAGREMGSADQCENDRVSSAVQASGGHLSDLIRAIALGPNFGVRVGGQ